MLTPWTAFTAVAFSTILGALAGLVPAVHAARLDPWQHCATNDRPQR